jgi:hydroxyacylglutathione hydrolase
MSLTIEAIPAFTDNYIWAIRDARHCVLVDPGEAHGPLEYLEHRGLELSAILLTHHHADHTGGVAGIRSRHPVPVWGPADERMPDGIAVVGEGDRVDIDLPELALRVLETPGHTRSHIVFHGEDMLFCGDTLFSVGCGRLFEGDAEQMQHSLDRIASLPDATRVFCAHEYTLANCRFAIQVEPNNEALRRRAELVADLRRADRITLPTRLHEEKSFNPFLRTRERSVIEAARRREPGLRASPAEVFRVIRSWKDAG